MSEIIKSLKELIDLQAVDSRLIGHHGSVTHPTLNLERTYCINCGKPKGWVSKESSEYIKAANIVVICDDCASNLGSLPLIEVDIPEYHF